MILKVRTGEGWLSYYWERRLLHRELYQELFPHKKKMKSQFANFFLLSVKPNCLTKHTQKDAAWTIIASQCGRPSFSNVGQCDEAQRMNGSHATRLAWLWVIELGPLLLWTQFNGNARRLPRRKRKQLPVVINDWATLHGGVVNYRAG